MLFCLIILIEKSFYNADSSIIPVLRKEIKFQVQKKNGGSIINVCTGAPPDEVMTLVRKVNLDLCERAKPRSV